MKNIFRKLAVLVFPIALPLLFSCTYNWHIEYWSKDIFRHQERAKSHSDKGERWAANFESKLAEEAKRFLTDAYVGRGSQSAAKKEYDRAIFDFSKAIELDPKSALAYHNRGAAYLEKGDYENAISDFTKALEIDPKDAEVFCERGIAYRKKGEYDLAFSDFNRALEINPRFGDGAAYNSRGNAYSDKGDYERALSDYAKAIEINSNVAMYYYNRARAYSHMGRLDQSISDYTKAIEVDPEYSKAYCNRGTVYEKRGQYNQAISDYNKTLEITPKDDLAYYGRGRVYSARAQYDRAVSDYSKALEINPEGGDVYWGRAVAYYYMTEYDKSWKDLRQTEKLGCQITPESINEFRKKLAIAEVLELSGTRKQLDQIPDLYRFMFEEGLKGELPELSSRIKRILPKIANELSCIIYQDSKAYLTKNYDQDRLSEVLQWWHSPLGMRICRLEVEATTVKAARKIWQQTRDMNPVSESRLAIFKRILELSGGHDLSVQADIKMVAGLSRAMNAYGLQERRLKEDQIQQLAEMAKDVFQESSEQAILHYTPRIYESISDEELLKYIEFLESSAGRWFSNLGGEVFIKALETSNEEIAHALFKGSLRKTCVSGN
jgi:tetratricopeptide (TPR) repeat protein